jgi:hypothetical protein
MAVRLSALRTGRAPLPRNIIFLLLILIYVRGRAVPRAIVMLEGLGKFKTVRDFIETGTLELQACSIAPEPLCVDVIVFPRVLNQLDAGAIGMCIHTYVHGHRTRCQETRFHEYELTKQCILLGPPRVLYEGSSSSSSVVGCCSLRGGIRLLEAIIGWGYGLRSGLSN